MSSPSSPPEACSTPHGEQLRAGFRDLRFQPDLEAQYRAASQQGLVHPTLVATLGAAAVWTAFIGVDLVRLDLVQRFPDWPPMLWQLVIARALVLLSFAVCAVALWSGIGGYRQQALVAGLLFLLALGSGAVMVVYRVAGVPHESYVLALVVMAIFMPLGLSFLQTVALALVCICAVTLQGILMLDGAAGPSFKRLSIVLTATGVVSAIGAYLREYAQRGQFLLQRELEWQATRDPLTGLFNRRVFNSHLDTLIRQAGDERCTVVLAMLDVDHFKLYNDTYGHQAGDLALQRLAQALQRLTVQPLDRAFRTGGEEMSLILYDATAEEVHTLCARMLHEVQQLAIVHAASATADHLSVSAGCAQLKAQESAASLYRRADQLLYQAKSMGRNCVALDADIGGRVLRAPAPQRATVAAS